MDQLHPGHMSVCAAHCAISQVRIFIQLPPLCKHREVYRIERVSHQKLRHTWAFPNHAPHRKLAGLGLEGLQPGLHLCQAVLPCLSTSLGLVPDEPDFTQHHDVSLSPGTTGCLVR